MRTHHPLYLLLFFFSTSCAQTDRTILIPDPADITYTTETVISESGIIWGMEFLPDGSMLVTEKSGKLIHFKNGQKVNIGGTPDVLNLGQGGFMGIKLHPNYEQNGWIYFSYASSEGGGDGGNTAVMRAKLQGNTLVENQLLYKAAPNSNAGQHFGSRIEFDNDGYLYFSIGDRGNRDVNPQDVTRDGGKIYRLNEDGSIPTDNPFVNQTNAKKAIYSYGHRNPQGMLKQPETGAIWVHEHGPRGGDEINIIKKGANYGWPLITYGKNYSGTEITSNTSLPGMEQPLYYWIPSIAPSGMTFVTGYVYPNWKGNLLVGSLVFRYLERMEIENNQVIKREKLLENIGRVRDVKQGPDGYIYLSVEGKGILKIVPKNS